MDKLQTNGILSLKTQNWTENEVKMINLYKIMTGNIRPLSSGDFATKGPTNAPV